MDTDTFLTPLYVMADDFCKYQLPPEKTPGPKPSLTRSEVVTLALFGQRKRAASTLAKSLRRPGGLPAPKKQPPALAQKAATLGTWLAADCRDRQREAALCLPAGPGAAAFTGWIPDLFGS